MLQSIKKFFKGSEIQEVSTEVKANPFKGEQETKILSFFEKKDHNNKKYCYNPLGI